MQYGNLIPTIYPTGVFIRSIEQTKTSDESGGENVFTATLTNHTQQRFVVKNGHTGSACEGINEIRASVDNSVGTPSVEVVETDAGTKKDINFIFKNLKGNPGNFELTEEVKQYIDDRLAEIKMPLNPICAYDMADISRGTILQELQSPIIEKRTAHIFGGYQIYTANKKSTYYHIHIETAYTGDARPIVIVYREDWAPETAVLYRFCNGIQDFTVFIPQQNYSFGIGVWMHGDGAYKVQPKESVSIYKLTVTELSDRMLVDSSGNDNHATVSGGVIKMYDTTTGTALSFIKGGLTNGFISFIGVGKQWTHSRWIKIDENAQDKTVNTRLWVYGQYDYAIMDIAANGGVVSDISLLCYKDEQNLHWFNIKKERIIDNQWHNLIVMTDLQESYCWRSFYLDGKKIGEKRTEANFKDFIHPVKQYEMISVVGCLASQLFFNRLLTELEVQWLAHNSYYPAKRYSLAEYKIDKK